MAYYCTRVTGRKDEDGNPEWCSGEIDEDTGRCDTCGAKG